jgi:hypothetical protein
MTTASTARELRASAWCDQILAVLRDAGEPLSTIETQKGLDVGGLLRSYPCRNAPHLEGHDEAPCERGDNESLLLCDGNQDTSVRRWGGTQPRLADEFKILEKDGVIERSKPAGQNLLWWSLSNSFETVEMSDLEAMFDSEALG